MKNQTTLTLSTSFGKMTISLFEEKAPLHCANFLKLAKEGYFDKTTFHRIIPGFMIQGGDPNSKSDARHTHGMGGPTYTIPAEIGLPNRRGSIAAARKPDMVNPKRESSGSQFYINLVDNTFLDGQYTVFAEVIEGLDVADVIVTQARDQRDNPLERIEMTITENPA